MIKYIVTTPNKFFRGIRAGVEFINGRGETTDENIANLLKSYGYNVEVENSPAPSSTRKRKVSKEVEEK